VLETAAEGTVVDGSVYAIPHWACALFLFHFAHDAKVAAANTRDALVAAIGSNHERGRGLLIDWKGHSTLNELYADSLLDLGLSPCETLTALTSDQLHPAAKSALSELIALSDIGSGRSEVAHEAWPPYYALEFAHGRGRALVGYSERMHHILQEIGAPTDSTPVVDPRTVSVKLYNQGGETGVPLLWVDSFAIAAGVTGEKLEAARKFLTFVVQDEIYREVLLLEGKAPQYLLPAYRNLFNDPALLMEAPLYSEFLPGLENAATLVGAGLPAAIEKTGALLDRELPANLRRE
jgi:thiamine pyridinylase